METTIGSDTCGADAVTHPEALVKFHNLEITLQTMLRAPDFERRVGAMLSEANLLQEQGFATDLNFVCREGTVVPAHAVVVRHVSPFMADLTKRKGCPCCRKTLLLAGMPKGCNITIDLCQSGLD